MKLKEIRELTRAEEEVMQVLWNLKQSFVKDMISYFKDPKPAYNTISTIVRILEEKGFIDHKAYGKAHEYFPLISKSEYSKFVLKNLTKGYFSNSFKSLLSFMAEEENLSLHDIEEIQKIIKQNNKK